MYSSNIFSKLCRLCSLEIEYGFDIFAESEVRASLVILINKYLPIKVNEDDFLPRQICESCHIGVAATVDLIDRMVQGQHHLRQLYKKFGKKTLHESNESLVAQDENETFTGPDISVKGETFFNEAGKEMVHTLISVQGDTPEIEMDDLAKGTEVKRVYESHPMVQIVEDTKVKKKRGRPPKKEKDKMQIQEPVIETECRPRRRTNLPSRFKDSFAGKELENVLKKESKENDIYNRFEEDEMQDDNGMNEGEAESLSFPRTRVLKEEEQTHSLEGNTVVVTPHHLDDAALNLPAAVNIELDFYETKLLSEESNEQNGTHTGHFPKASISVVQENEQFPSSVGRKFVSSFSRNRMLLLRKKERNAYRKSSKYFCEICSSRYLSAVPYINHMKIHKNVVLHCDECEEKFSLMDELKSHQRDTNHSGIGIMDSDIKENVSFKCHLCHDRNFSTLERFKKHYASMHEGQKPFLCSVCNKRFSYKHSLNTHLASHQKFSENQSCFSCEKCDKTFGHKASLKYHENSVHNPERKYICRICGTAFKNRVILRRHMVVHTDNRPYRCTQCLSCFKSASNLYSHMTVHSSTKNFSCIFCLKKFTRRSVLERHLILHTDEKSFACTTCGKHFRQKSNLLEHYRIHSGEKPFQCVICDKKFTTSSQLCLHNKRHHLKEQKFSCSVCCKEFNSMLALMNHESDHAKEKGHPDTKVEDPVRDKELIVEKQLKCVTCQRNFSDVNVLSKHMEEHQLEKSWFIAQPSLSENVASSTSQELIYVFPRKEEFHPFVHDGSNATPYAKVIYSTETPIGVPDSSFEITLKESDSLAFTIPGSENTQAL